MKKRIQIQLHLQPAKWYTFQPQSWYIIEPLHTATVLGVKTGRQKRDQIVFGFVDGAFTEKQIRDLQRYDVSRVVAAVNKGLAPSGEKLDIGDTTYIICSLASVRDATIQKVLWHYSKFGFPVKMYINETNGFWEKAVFIDNIKSITDLKTRLRSVFI